MILPRVEINPPSTAKGVVIWMHGLGADGHDFEAIVPELGLPQDCPLRFVFPHAPKIPVTINNGYVMPAWYDIRQMNLLHEADEEGIAHSVNQVRQLIANELENGFVPEQIVLAGFSQGGVIAIYTALQYERKLAGLMALSTYIPAPQTLENLRGTVNQDIPVLMCHGTVDPVVPFIAAEHGHKLLTDWKYNVEWKNYPMPHSVCPDEIRDISDWLVSVFR